MKYIYFHTIIIPDTPGVRGHINKAPEDSIQGNSRPAIPTLGQIPPRRGNSKRAAEASGLSIWIGPCLSVGHKVCTQRVTTPLEDDDDDEPFCKYCTCLIICFVLQ